MIPALPAPTEPPPRPGGDTDAAAGGPGEAEGEPGVYAEEDLEDLFAAAHEDDM